MTQGEPTYFAMIFQVLMGAIGGLATYMLHGIRAELRAVKEQLQAKVDKEDCKEHRANCFPASLSDHSHEGLDPNARVIGKAFK